MVQVTDLRHANNNMRITYNDLLPGDKIWVQGELFEVTEIFGYKNNETVIIRFKGNAVKGYNNLIGTGFDHALYGASANVRCTIVKRTIN